MSAESDSSEQNKERPTESNDLQALQEGTGGMSRQEIAELICKTIALVLFAQGTYHLIHTIVLLFVELSPILAILNGVSFYAPDISPLVLLPMVSPLILGWFFWKKSEAIARRMVPSNPSAAAGNTLSIQDLKILVFSALGVLVLIRGIQRLLAVVFLVKSYSLVTSEFWFSPETWSGLLEFFIGLWLLLGSRGIVKGIKWLRTVGIEHDG